MLDFTSRHLAAALAFAALLLPACGSADESEPDVADEAPEMTTMSCNGGDDHGVLAWCYNQCQVEQNDCYASCSTCDPFRDNCDPTDYCYIDCDHQLDGCRYMCDRFYC